MRGMKRLRRFIRSALEIQSIDEEARIRNTMAHLLHENTKTRRSLRILLSNRPERKAQAKEGEASFSYQWRNLTQGKHLLTNPAFRKNVASEVCRLTLLPPDWFNGKMILDAGCGNGRYSYAFTLLGGNVSAFDTSLEGVNDTQKVCIFHLIRCFKHDILIEVKQFKEAFDLVWCYGVIHHTHNPFRAFSNVASYVKPGGLLFIMIYGEPRPTMTQDFQELNGYDEMRTTFEGLTLQEKNEQLSHMAVDDIHRWFDAASPPINELFSFKELYAWLRATGFTDIKQTLDSRNHHLIARKML